MSDQLGFKKTGAGQQLGVIVPEPPSPPPAEEPAPAPPPSPADEGDEGDV